MTRTREEVHPSMGKPRRKRRSLEHGVKKSEGPHPDKGFLTTPSSRESRRKSLNNIRPRSPGRVTREGRNWQPEGLHSPAPKIAVRCVSNDGLIEEMNRAREQAQDVKKKVASTTDPTSSARIDMPPKMATREQTLRSQRSCRALVSSEDESEHVDERNAPQMMYFPGSSPVKNKATLKSSNHGDKKKDRNCNSIRDLSSFLSLNNPDTDNASPQLTTGSVSINSFLTEASSIDNSEACLSLATPDRLLPSS